MITPQMLINRLVRNYTLALGEMEEAIFRYNNFSLTDEGVDHYDYAAIMFVYRELWNARGLTKELGDPRLVEMDDRCEMLISVVKTIEEDFNKEDY